MSQRLTFQSPTTARFTDSSHGRYHTIHALKAASHVVENATGVLPLHSVFVARHPDCGEAFGRNLVLQGPVLGQVVAERLRTERLDGQIQRPVHGLVEETVVKSDPLPVFALEVRFHPR